MSIRKSMLTLAALATFSTFAAHGTAQATVVKSVSGSATTGLTTTYTESFNNNATSFSTGEYNAASTSDDYLWLTSSQKASWSFTTATALKSVSISFFYSVPGADTGFFKFASNSVVALADTTGTAAQFKLNNPGVATGGLSRADDFDSSFKATYTNLAAGTYTLTFATDAPDCDALSGLKVDDLKITTISAVPEPETYALMLAGLGILCFLARRRSGRND
jgi:hypothetical protein